MKFILQTKCTSLCFFNGNQWKSARASKMFKYYYTFCFDIRLFFFRKLYERRYVKFAAAWWLLYVVLFMNLHAIYEFVCYRFSFNWSICVQSMCMLFFIFDECSLIYIISTYRSFTFFSLVFVFVFLFHLKLTLFPRSCFRGYRFCFAIFLTIWYRGYDRFNNHRTCGRFGRVPERGECCRSYCEIRK